MKASRPLPVASCPCRLWKARVGGDSAETAPLSAPCALTLRSLTTAAPTRGACERCAKVAVGRQGALKVGGLAFPQHADSVVGYREKSPFKLGAKYGDPRLVRL